MREIKFRAWDLEKKIWRQPCNALKFNAFNGAVEVNTDDTSSDIRITQYTGLKDKNGVEIYEGDIILTADDLRKQAVGNWKPKMRVVEWTDNKEYKTGFNLGRAQNGKCEVIGNIYEHGHLLEQTNDQL